MDECRQSILLGSGERKQRSGQGDTVGRCARAQWWSGLPQMAFQASGCNGTAAMDKPDGSPFVSADLAGNPETGAQNASASHHDARRPSMPASFWKPHHERRLGKSDRRVRLRRQIQLRRRKYGSTALADIGHGEGAKFVKLKVQIKKQLILQCRLPQTGTEQPSRNVARGRSAPIKGSPRPGWNRRRPHRANRLAAACQNGPQSRSLPLSRSSASSPLR